MPAIPVAYTMDKQVRTITDVRRLRRVLCSFVAFCYCFGAFERRRSVCYADRFGQELALRCPHGRHENVQNTRPSHNTLSAVYPGEDFPSRYKRYPLIAPQLRVTLFQHMVEMGRGCGHEGALHVCISNPGLDFHPLTCPVPASILLPLLCYSLPIPQLPHLFSFPFPPWYPPIYLPSHFFLLPPDPPFPSL